MVISLGDEITMTGTLECLSDTSFSAFLKAKQIVPSTVGCVSYTTCKMMSTVPNAGGSVAPPSNMNSSSALLWYYSQIFTHDCGIANFQNKTIIAKNNSADTTVGANMGPLKNDWLSSTFIGQTFQVRRILKSFHASGAAPDPELHRTSLLAWYVNDSSLFGCPVGSRVSRESTASAVGACNRTASTWLLQMKSFERGA